MGLRQCDKCSEMVDEAKAFCPGCGHAFVEEEKRQEASKFEKLDHTVEFGKTMYNQMLTDMGLNLSNPSISSQSSVQVLKSITAEPVKVEAVEPVKQEVIEPVRAEVVEPVKVETVEPVKAEAVEPVKAEVIVPPLEVKVPEKETVRPPEQISVETKSTSNLKWYILGGVMVVILFPIALASTIFLFLEIWSRMSR